jgi:hypothetical protein
VCFGPSVLGCVERYSNALTLSHDASYLGSVQDNCAVSTLRCLLSGCMCYGRFGGNREILGPYGVTSKEPAAVILTTNLILILFT